MFKYADDTNLSVLAYSDVSLLSEFEHVKQWAADNKIIINVSKTKELVFQRPSLKHFLAPSAVCGIEQVRSAKLLGGIFKNNLSFDKHVTAVLKSCSQRAKLPYFGTRVCCRYIWILYFMHLCVSSQSL